MRNLSQRGFDTTRSKKRVTQPPAYRCHSDREAFFASMRNLSHSVQGGSRDAESFQVMYFGLKCNFLFKL